MLGGDVHKIKFGLIVGGLLLIVFYSIIPLLVILLGLFLFNMKGSFNMNALKKLGFIFKSKASKTLDQFLDAQELSTQIKADLDKAIFKLTNSLTEVTESRIRLIDSKTRYESQLKDVNSQILSKKQQGDELGSRKLAVKALQYTNLIQGQSEAIARVRQVEDQLKGKIRDMHDTKSEVEVASEVLQAEYETYSTLNAVSAHGGSVAIKSDALELLKSLSQRSKTEYLAKTETAEFTQQFETMKPVTTVSSDEIDNYINNLK
jgi:phage shock protein A